MAFDTLISFQNVSFTYEEEETDAELAVKDISFTVNPGEFLCILGRNGSGKSTLAKLANALLISQEGKVFVEGLDSADEENSIDIKKRVGLVFQNPDNQIVASIVEEDVAFGPENLCLAPAEIRSRVESALASVGIADLRKQETYRLSGGQKQRVAIAGIIAMRPDCIVLDEPTAMLDPKGRRDVLETLQRLNKSFGIAVVLITHFMEEAVNADRILVMHNGNIVKEGIPAQVFSDLKLLTDCGLELPGAARLARDLVRHGGIPLPDRILTPEALIDAIDNALKNRGVPCRS